MRKPSSFIYRNLANAVSILGVLPLCILFGEGGYQFLIPLIIYNNMMDDLDGVLAAKLNIRSEFGAILDNVCDSIAHTIIVMIVGVHFGGVCAVASLVGVTAMVLRGVTRLDPGQATGTGSPTNEMIRHVFFILVLAQIFEFSAAPYLTAAFLLHTVSMLIPYKLPYLIRGMTKSALAIGLVNVALIVAWLVPSTAPVIAACFVVSYLYSLLTAIIQRRRVDEQPATRSLETETMESDAVAAEL
ncbi:MAG: CDP-alcohol phosphatidyltransferase family protein [Pirellulaceae bacterium]|jgi:phosphatidylserine synthase|nr:CDP-alcohol phosphatidyltransferase family protein [Pirellulaceae bacterium]